MLTIVFAHTGELYPMGSGSINLLTFCMFAYRESLMAAFYIASGYGFRKRSIGKCIDQQVTTLLKPYIYTGIATTVFHFLIHYLCYGSLHNATYETGKVLGGFALGLPHTADLRPDLPRAASVPFEMAVAPYLPQDANIRVWMVVYSLVFFLVALWLCMTPGKLVSRIGNFLTPSLLILLVFLFISFLFRGQVNIAAPQTEYSAAPFLKGFSEGYQTMDTIAALNFGLVIATTLGSFGLTQRKDVLHHTVKAGLFAGLILSAVYMMLSYMGMCSSGVYDIQENGAWTLRCIVFQLFGEPGAYLLAAIFTLACLTTCVGLINSISQYFSHLFSRISYRKWVFLIIGFSFLICNLGLTVILSISIPILNAIYPIAIVLILLGITHRVWAKNRYVYPIVVAGTGVVSVLYALDTLHLPLGILGTLCHALPLYEHGFGWVSVALAMLLIALPMPRIFAKQKRA